VDEVFELRLLGDEALEDRDELVAVEGGEAGGERGGHGGPDEAGREERR
jgi:hypothetical protein